MNRIPVLLCVFFLAGCAGPTIVAHGAAPGERITLPPIPNARCDGEWVLRGSDNVWTCTAAVAVRQGTPLQRWLVNPYVQSYGYSSGYIQSCGRRFCAGYSWVR
ncbi:MAG TPA: hypothetical protein VFP46_00755 [Candidatus Paceibacterota bacterium]|nr:hypothetical protein [Candidatus Paceibacterota bacterium]